MLFWFFDTSIGVGQVRVSTARFLEDQGYIETTTSPHFLVSRDELIASNLMDNTYNIRCVAAYCKYWQDTWSSTLDISNRPEILGTLFNLGVNANSPNKSPKANSFGEYVGKSYSHVKDMLY